MGKVISLSALGYNYIYLFVYQQGRAVVVDPGDAGCVLSALKKHFLRLDAILITHHHFDHTAGAGKLKKKTGCEIIRPDKNRISLTDKEISDSDVLEFGRENIKVISTPGHTSTSVCYYVQPSESNEDGILFTGDTMFTAGCGRVFECPAEIMWKSLNKLAALPETTLVYPGHNYTIENYQFALNVEPENQAVIDCLNNPSHPSTIALEKQTNVFIRAGSVEVFAELRSRKNRF